MLINQKFLYSYYSLNHFKISLFINKLNYENKLNQEFYEIFCFKPKLF